MAVVVKRLNSSQFRHNRFARMLGTVTMGELRINHFPTLRLPAAGYSCIVLGRDDVWMLGRQRKPQPEVYQGTNPESVWGLNPLSPVVALENRMIFVPATRPMDSMSVR